MCVGGWHCFDDDIVLLIEAMIMVAITLNGVLGMQVALTITPRKRNPSWSQLQSILNLHCLSKREKSVKKNL